MVRRSGPCFIPYRRMTVIERAKRAHSLFMSIEISDIYIYIGIYVRVVRVWCPVFSVYSGSSIILKYFERAKRTHSLFMSIEISDIYICSRSSRLVYPFPPYTPEAPVKIILKFYSILGISGNFNVCGSSRFQS